MPKGLYTRKGANGRKMFFRDGKLISEKKYKASMKARRGNTNRKRSPNGNNKRRNGTMAKRSVSIPHPSITGMAAGLSMAAFLNSATTAGDGTAGSSVIRSALDGNFTESLNKLASNSFSLINTDQGRKIMVTLIGTAAGGAFLRKALKSPKIGGQKLYFNI